MLSIVIPAHNEEKVIGRLLKALHDGLQSRELEIIVVCNGCSDRSAEVARGFGSAMKVLETEVSSKTNALNLGDAAATGFPRFYVDADVVLRLEDLRQLAQRLETGDVLAVSPRIALDLEGCSWAVRAFYGIDVRMPSHRETIGGSGVYGLSKAGRMRFERFPDITADDGFVRRQCRPGERCSVEGCWSTVTPPRLLSGVITIKTRSHLGNYELDRLYPELRGNIGQSNRRVLLRLATQPWLWLKLAVYGYVKLVARVRARRQLRSGVKARWERDETSRQVAASSVDHE